MCLLSLPNEILHELPEKATEHGRFVGKPSFARRLRLHPTVQRLGAVNRRLRSICLPVLFRDIDICLDRSALRSDEAFIEGFLLSNPEISALIRCVSLPHFRPLS